MVLDSIKALIRRLMVWKMPGKNSVWQVITDYELVKTIYVSNTIFLVKIETEYKYFRPIESSVSSLASFCRSMGTEEMGKLLGIERIHPKSILAELPGLGRGVLQDNAMGTSIMPLPETERLTKLTPVFQREINNLNLLDVLCWETDHSPNNYNVVFNSDGSLAGLSVFDNNGRGTFACRVSVRFSTYKHISPLVTEDGFVNRPHLCALTNERLEQITFNKLFAHLRRYLRLLPLVFLYWRIMRIRHATRKSAARDSNFLLGADEWSEETLREELCGKYGKTYLVGFLQDCVPHE